MKYSELVKVYEELERTSSKLSKTDILSELFKNTTKEDLYQVVLLVQGLVFPKYSGYELGIALQMMLRAIARSSGFSQEKVEEMFKKTGDLGLVAEECVKTKKQVSLVKKELNVENVFKNLQKLA